MKIKAKTETNKKESLKGVIPDSKKANKKAKNAEKKKNVKAESAKATISSDLDNATVLTNGKQKNANKPKQQAKKTKKGLKEQSGDAVAKNVETAVAITAPTEEQTKKKKQKKEKKGTDTKDVATQKLNAEKLNDNRSEKDLAKIEKKKAKKLALKLKKKQKKLQEKTDIKENGSETQGTQDATAVKDAAKAAQKLKKKEKKLSQKKNAGAVSKVQNHKSTEDDAASNAATVFVGNLPVNTKRVQLLRLFKDFEPVNSIRFRTAGGKVIFKHKVRKEASTLNAYVVLKDAATVERALALNGVEFKGNHLRVTAADKNAHNRSDADAKRMIFVGNLKYSANEEKLREIFSSCGEIDYVRCLQDGEKGCKGVAYVCFKAAEAVGLAMELNETILDERPIHVERYSVNKLGAKKERDDAAATQKQTQTGAKKRLDGKKQKGGDKQKQAIKKNAPGGDNKQKKSEFRGVKVGGIKKKQNKKKVTSQMSQLAKKIAPKTV